MKMKFIGFRPFWVTFFASPDVSFGLHFCLAGRIDIHILWWMISIGRVPIYEWGRDGARIAVGNSFHANHSKPLRERALP